MAKVNHLKTAAILLSVTVFFILISTLTLANGMCVIVDENAIGTPGTGGVVAECPTGYEIMGGGWSVYNENTDDNRPQGNGWYCEYNSGLGGIYGDPFCHAICCDDDYVDTIVVEQEGIMVFGIFAQCPFGYTIVGGGFTDILDFTSDDVGSDQDDLEPFANGWYCRDDESFDSGSTCYGVCARAVEPEEELVCTTEIAPIVVDGLQSSGTAYCPVDYFITGGGFLDISDSDDDQDWSQPITTPDDGWYCYDDFDDAAPEPGWCFARCCTFEPKTLPTCSVDYLYNEDTHETFFFSDSIYIEGSGFYLTYGSAEDASSPLDNVQYNRSSPDTWLPWTDTDPVDGLFNELYEEWQSDPNDEYFVYGHHTICCRAVDIFGNGEDGLGTCQEFYITDCTDADGDGYDAYDELLCPQGDDCDDSNPDVNPGAEEICNGIDDDCDGQIDEGDVCPPEPETGSITVCKIIIDAEDNIITGSSLPETTFTIPGMDAPDGSGFTEIGMLPNTEFDTPLAFNADLIGDSSLDAECVTHSGLLLGMDGYFYDEEIITGDEEDWIVLYNDQYNVTIDGLEDFYEYSTDYTSPYNINADGNIVLASWKPDRTLVILNKFIGQQCQEEECEECDDDDNGDAFSPPTYWCMENWDCTEWSTCAGGIQTRECEDFNDCGTYLHRPTEQQSCTGATGSVVYGQGSVFDAFIASQEKGTATAWIYWLLAFLGLLILLLIIMLIYMALRR